jgi:hypothetical protein
MTIRMSRLGTSEREAEADLPAGAAVQPGE